jgi:endoglucanase
MDEILKELTYKFGASGSEEEVKNFLKEKLKNFDIFEDNFGNLIVSNAFSKDYFLFLTGIDESSFFISEKEKDFYKFKIIGDYKPLNIIDRFVIFKDGKKGIIRSLKEKDIDFSDLRVEILGNKSAEIGEPFIIEPFFYEDDEFLISSNIDARIFASLLIRLIKKFPLKIVFLVKTKLNQKGILPGIKDESAKFFFFLKIFSDKEINLGKGPFINFLGKEYVMPLNLKNKIISIVKEEDIPFQIGISEEPSQFYYYLFSSGFENLICVSLPLKYKESVYKIIKKIDVLNMERLFEIFLKKL